MSKKFSENSIFVKSIENVHSLMNEYKREQCITFVCECCGKTSSKKLSSFNRPNASLKCYSCWLKEFHTGKNFVSKDVRSRAAKQAVSKRNQTISEKYGTHDNFYALRENSTRKTCQQKYGTNNAAQSKDIKYKIEQTNLKKYGCKNVAQSYEVLCKMRKKYIWNNIYFDSSWELATYIYLIDHQISFEFHPKIKFKYTFENKDHFYFPDFIIENEIIEIKNEVLFNRMQIQGTIDNAKFICMQQNNVKVLFRKDIKPYIDYVSVKYGKTFLRECRNEKNSKV